MGQINQAEVLIGARSQPEIYRQLLIFPMLDDIHCLVWVRENVKLKLNYRNKRHELSYSSSLDRVALSENVKSGSLDIRVSDIRTYLARYLHRTPHS